MWALIPIKTLSGAKRRLSPVLSPHHRQCLARAMACDVINSVVASNQLEGVLVVSDDPGVESISVNAGCVFLRESGCRGLNEAVTQGTHWLRDRSVDSMVVIHSDLPLLNTSDLDALIDRHCATPTITVVPDRAGKGSNLLVYPLAKATQDFRFQYGANSLQRHRLEAQRIGIDFAVESMPELQFDIDSPQDLYKLMDSGLLRSDSETGCYLNGIYQAASGDNSSTAATSTSIEARYLFENLQPVNAHG